MIIWTEKQYQAFLKKSGMSEPTTEKVEASPALSKPMPTMPVQAALAVPHNVGRDMNWLVKVVFIICLTVFAITGMVHSWPSDAKPTVSVEHVVKAKPVKHRHKAKHHVKKKCQCECKKVLTEAQNVSIENVETRLKG